MRLDFAHWDGMDDGGPVYVPGCVKRKAEDIGDGSDDVSTAQPSNSFRKFGHECIHECNEYMPACDPSGEKSNHGMHVQCETSIANSGDLHINSGSTHHKHGAATLNV